MEPVHPPVDSSRAATAGMFDELWAVHREDGYAAGYRRAASELLADLMLFGQEFARDLPGHDDAAEAARQAVRRFARKLAGHLECRIEQSRSSDADLADGLGI